MMTSHNTATGWAQVKTKSYGLIQPANPEKCRVKRGVPTAGIRKLRKRAIPAAMEAMEAGRPTIECIHPKMKPQVGPKPRRRYAYSPPASGMAAPSSAKESAPNIERIAPTIQAA